jgi:hypothetical protein
VGQFRLLRWKGAMSLLKKTLQILAAVALMVTASTGNAQQFHPFIDPMEFNPDWQWFAPVDLAHWNELSAKKRANIGWFASHDRTYLWLSRPEVAGSSQFRTDGAGDFVWGHRTDVGFMQENNTGWMVNFRRMNTGCRGWNEVLTERINRLEEDDEGGGTFFPWPDRNDPFYAGRFYNVKSSINVATFNNFELNRTWRKSPYRYGGILEAFGGFKYANFRDIAQDQSYSRSTVNINEPGAFDTETQLEILETDRTVTLNRMVGGQLGLRYFTHYNRWRLGGEFRAFLAGNFQTSTNTFTEDLTYYSGGPDLGVDVTTTGVNSFMFYRTNQATVWGYEVRADAAYQLTKYIGVRGGVEFLELARGIWRGGTAVRGNTDSTNQSVFMAGMTFGVEINR